MQGCAFLAGGCAQFSGNKIYILLYIKAWNHLVNGKERYMPDWRQTISGEDILKAYRAKELISLIEEIGNIDTMSYELMLKILDHIEISNDDKVEVIFLAGMRIKFGYVTING